MIPFAQPFSAGGVRQPAFVQAANAAASSLAFSSPNTAGNLLVVHQAYDNTQTGPVTSVTDTQGNKWVLALKVVNTPNTENSELWYCENCRGGPNTVTCNGVAGTFDRISVLEASGVARSNALIATNSALDTTSPISSGAITPTHNYAYLIGALQMGGAATITPGAGWTTRSTDANQEAILHDQVLVSAAAVDLNPTFTGSTNGLAIIVAFRPLIT